MVYGVKELAQNGFGRAPVLWLLAGLAAGLVFVRRQGRLRPASIHDEVWHQPGPVNGPVCAGRSSHRSA
jgi:hypothetical protein